VLDRQEDVRRPVRAPLPPLDGHHEPPRPPVRGLGGTEKNGIFGPDIGADRFLGGVPPPPSPFGACSSPPMAPVAPLQVPIAVPAGPQDSLEAGLCTPVDVPDGGQAGLGTRGTATRCASCPPGPVGRPRDVLPDLGAPREPPRGTSRPGSPPRHPQLGRGRALPPSPGVPGPVGSAG
jgi:hypothetical protein